MVKDAEKEDSSSSSSLAKVISGPASKDPRVQESMSTPSETTAKKLKRTKDELEVEDVEKEDSSSCVEKDVSEPAPKDPRVQQSTPGPIGTHAKKLKQTEDELESSDKEISLADQLDFECTRSLQTMFRRKLAEAEACDVDDKLTALQKRMAENMNILQKTTERLKNVTFNKEVDALHKLRYPNYGRVLETLDNANCKEYLETINKKLEQSQNQLRIKNIDLPDGGTTELAQIISETLAACEKMKANNNLELPKVMAEVKASNNSTSEALSRCLDLLPEVEDVMLDRATLEICARNED